MDNFVKIPKMYATSEESSINIIDVLSIAVNYPAGNLVGDIHWVPIDTIATINCLVDLPDSSFMVMFEKVVNGTEVVGDIRRPANITGGVMTLEVRFKDSGNYVLSSERLNKGLAVIGAPFRLSSFRIEFDVYDLI